MKRRIAAAAALSWLLLCGVANRKGIASDQTGVTFDNQIVRLLQKHCQVCHHDGDIAPFSLVSYEDASRFGEAAQTAVEKKEMPPWKAAAGCGQFDGDRRLSGEELQQLADWVSAGKPEGDPHDLPPPLVFTENWPLGQPDVVLEPDADFQVNIGDDLYRYFSLPTDLRGDRFLSAIDVRPGARSIVHHAILYVDPNGKSKKFEERDPKAGFESTGGADFLTEGAGGWWIPGHPHGFEPDGTGWLLPNGARIVLKIHYHVHHGNGGSDRSQVGLYFARTPVPKQLRVLPVANTDFVIPPGESHYKLNASAVIPPGQNVHALGIAAQMQLLGREMQVQAAGTDGATRCLIDLKEWDPHWQGLYRFKDPIPLSSGARLNLSAFYDNSEGNSENPNFPPQPMHYGERTTDETCMAFVKYTLDAESRTLSTPEISGIDVDSSGQLIVSGKGFLDGADIEVNQQRVADTRNHKKKAAKRLLSSAAWTTLISAGHQVSITVLNPDGVRSTAVSFSR